jgi:4-hydroxy-tetrahydrodipicolinate synthase
MNQLKGTGVAIVTPFKADYTVDTAGLAKVVEHIIAGKVNYIVVLGTTGETATLTREEKQLVIDTVAAANNQRVPLVLGAGGNNTQEVIDTVKNMPRGVFEAVLSVSPYYNKPSQEGIVAHYKAIAAASPLPVILYNVPSRTSSNINPETTLRLAKEKNIIGIKEASNNLEQHMKIIKNRPEGFLHISGDDNLTLPILAAGGDGVISVLANAFPKDFSAMVQHALKSDLEKARTLHYKLMDITDQLFADGNPGGVKAALQLLGICGDTLRLPLVNVNKAVYDQLEQLIKTYR